MNLLQRVAALEVKGKGMPTGDDWIVVTHMLCSAYGWTWEELKRQPIKFVLGLLDKLAIEKKNEMKRWEGLK